MTEDWSRRISVRASDEGCGRPTNPDDLRGLVAVDLGAESCRISLLRWIDGEPMITLAHRFANNARNVDGSLRWNLSWIESGVEEGLRRCAMLAPEGIRSIAVDGWAVDYVLLNSQGNALTDPFCYRDERTVASQASLHARISAARMRELTGVQISRINTVYQLHAEPAAMRNATWANLPEYILYRLGGRRVAERTNASHTQMLGLADERKEELASPAWSEEIFEAAGIDPAGAPELVSPGTVIGRLTGDLAKLPALAEAVLIAPATHDTASAIAGIPAEGEDWAYISSGTWSLVGTTLGCPENGAGARGGNYTNLGGVGGSTLFHRNVNGMWLLRQCLNRWSVDTTALQFDQLIAAAEHGAIPRELLDVDDPNFLLPGDMPARINVQLRERGLSEMDESAGNAAAIASLIFHSLATRYAEVLADISRLTGKTFSRVYILGGGSRNLFLNKLTESATHIPVVRGSQESSTVGNFAVQLAVMEANTNTSPSQKDVFNWASTLSSCSVDF